MRELRRFEEAEESFRRAFAVNNDPAARTLIERGWLGVYRQKYEKAISDFQQVLDKPSADSDDKSEARAGLIASLYAKQFGDPAGREQAENLVNAWLEDKAGISEVAVQEVLMSAAAELSYLNNYEAALLAYDRVLKINRKNDKAGKAYELKMEALKWLRLPKKVVEVFKQAQQDFQADASVILNLWNEMGDALYRQKRFQEALDFFCGEALKTYKFPNPALNTDLAQKLADDKYAIEWTIVLLRKVRRFSEAEQKVDEALSRTTSSPSGGGQLHIASSAFSMRRKRK